MVDGIGNYLGKYWSSTVTFAAPLGEATRSKALGRGMREPSEDEDNLRDICLVAGNTRIFWVNSPFFGRISEI